MYLYGERVRIHLPQGSVYIPPHMYDYHGTEAMVERVLFFASRRAYELFGVTSPKGKMYTFEEEWLVPVEGSKTNEADRTDHEVLG